MRAPFSEDFPAIPFLPCSAFPSCSRSCGLPVQCVAVAVAVAVVAVAAVAVVVVAAAFN